MHVFLCCTALNKLFYTTDVYTSQDKIIAECTQINQFEQVQKFTVLILNTVLLPGCSMTVMFCDR